MSIQFLSSAKTGPELIVDLLGFTEPPIVVVTPKWINQYPSTGVLGIETVTSVTAKQCKIISNNHAPADYYVNIMAITPGSSSFGSLSSVAGRAQKTSQAITINYNTMLVSPDPVVLLAPYFSDSTSPVVCMETLDVSSPSECQVESGSFAPSNYFTSYISSNIGKATVAGKTVMNGIANKTANTIRVYFDQQFTAAPIVLVSPWFNDGNNYVQNPETIVNITRDYFDVVSGNAAPNYFLCWVAYGTLAS